MTINSSQHKYIQKQSTGQTVAIFWVKPPSNKGHLFECTSFPSAPNSACAKLRVPTPTSLRHLRDNLCPAHKTPNQSSNQAKRRLATVWGGTTKSEPSETPPVGPCQHSHQRASVSAAPAADAAHCVAVAANCVLSLATILQPVTLSRFV